MPWSRAADESLVRVRQTQRLCNFCAVPFRERKTGGICSRSRLGANGRKATMFCKGTALRERSCHFPRHKEKYTQSLSGCFKCLFPSRGMMSGGCSAPQPPKPPSVPCSTSRGAPSQPPESQVLSLPHWFPLWLYGEAETSQKPSLWRVFLSFTSNLFSFLLAETILTSQIKWEWIERLSVVPRIALWSLCCHWAPFIQHQCCQAANRQPEELSSQTRACLLHYVTSFHLDYSPSWKVVHLIDECSGWTLIFIMLNSLYPLLISLLLCACQESMSQQFTEQSSLSIYQAS